MDVSEQMMTKNMKTAPDDPDTLAAIWIASVAHYNARQREAHLLERLQYHERMLVAHERTFAELAEHHRVGKARCEELLGHA